MIKLGVHVSIAGGLTAAVERAHSLKCTAFQIFLRNPRSFQVKEYPQDEIKDFKAQCKKARISMIVAHCVYTQNLISSSRKVHDFSVQEFIQDACEAGKLGIPYIVTHTGSYKGSSPAQGLERLIESLKSILDRIPPEVTVLLENSASSTNSLGYRLEELAAVFEKLKTRQNIGLCLDTCHMFAAGYDIRKKEVVETVVKEINSTIGMHRLKVIHLNDSKFDIGTFKDRHQHIGKGKIGLVGIKNVLGQKEFSRAVFILETPKDAEEDDAKNLSVVRKVYKQCTS